MRLFIVALVLTLGSVQTTFSQPEKVKLGDVSKGDFNTPEYEENEAVVLFDIGQTDFDYKSNDGQWVFVFKRHIRIKINNPNGYGWADVKVRVYDETGNSERIGGIKGYTHKLVNGKIQKIKMDSKSVFDEQINDYWKYKKFTLPDVSEGDIIEYQYTITSPFWYNLRSWTFQRDIPCKWSEYEVRIPEYFKYTRFVSGFLPMTVNETSGTSRSRTMIARGQVGVAGVRSADQSYKDEYRVVVERFAIKDVPPFVIEPYISAPENYISEIDFELQTVHFPGGTVQNYAKSWETLNKEFVEHSRLGEAPNHVGYLKDEVEILSQKYQDKYDLMIAINNFIRNSFEWNNFVGKYVSTTLRQAYNKKSGNVADINLNLVGMLRLAEFDVNPVLISTRSNGALRPEFPLSEKLNYVIAMVVLDEKVYYLDAVNKTVPSGYLPEQCYNGKGLMISPAGPRMVDVVPNVLKSESLLAMLNLNSEAELNGTIRISSSNYSGFPKVASVVTKGEDQYLEKFSDAKQGWQIVEHSIKYETDGSKPFMDEVKVDDIDIVEEAGDLVYLSPTLNEGYQKNPFNLEQRTYPVDFTVPFATNYTISLTVDSSFVIEEVPESVSMVLPDKSGIFLFNCAVNGSQVQVQSRLQIRKPVYTQYDYPDLREFFSMIVNKQSEPIVLKRK